MHLTRPFAAVSEVGAAGDEYLVIVAPDDFGYAARGMDADFAVGFQHKCRKHSGSA